MRSCDTGQWIPCFDTGQYFIDHNMDVYYQVKHRLQASTLARKFDIRLWFACGADRRVKERMVKPLPKFLGWTDYQIFLGMELHSREKCTRGALLSNYPARENS